MKYLLFGLLLIHAFIHSLGYRQAFGLISTHQFTQPISKLQGILWLIASILFTVASLLVLLEVNEWRLVSVAGVALSQYLIFIAWHDAKHGTLVNVILLCASLFNYGGWSLQ